MMAAMRGWFITFEGTEGSGKSTQLPFLAARFRAQGHKVRILREPGGTPIGEEIRHTLKHSKDNDAMTPEAEMLLMNASRAQLVREVIRPALDAGETVLCDRFYDSTVVYQGYGRRLNLDKVRSVIDFAVGETRPDITLLLLVSPEVSEARRLARQSTLPFMRDRIEGADRDFFDRVAHGYEEIAKQDPDRICVIDAAGSVESTREQIWTVVASALERKSRKDPGSTGPLLL